MIIIIIIIMIMIMIMIMIIIIIIKQANDNKLIILKRQVFNDLFKVSIVADGLIDKGIVCHNIGAAIINAQSPIVFFVLNSRTYRGVGGRGEGGCHPLLRFFGIFSQTIKHQHLRFSVTVRIYLARILRQI